MKLFDLEFELREEYQELPKILDYLNNLIFTDSAIGKIEVNNYNYQSNGDPKYYIKIDVMLKSSAFSIGIRRDLNGTLAAETNENLVNLFLMEDIMNEMRKDLGMKKVKKGNLLAFFVNDIKSILKK